jgi:DNA-binding transcriptional regulator YhcF (GntR family)
MENFILYVRDKYPDRAQNINRVIEEYQTYVKKQQLESFIREFKQAGLSRAEIKQAVDAFEEEE